MELNSKEYLNNLYSGDWQKGYQDAYKRLDKEIELLDEYPIHLDVGCADGYFTTQYLKKYPNSLGIGIDISDVVVKNLDNLMVADCYDLPFAANSFDLVHAAELIEHLKDPQKALAEMVRVLKPGGHLILTTPYMEHPLYEEHYWSWDEYDMIKLVNLELIEYNPKFFGNIMRLVFKK